MGFLFQAEPATLFFVNRCFYSLTIYFFAILTCFGAAQGQTPTPSPTPTPPSSDIFIIELKTDQGKMKFGQPLKITNFVGYNNQPSFLPDGQSAATSKTPRSPGIWPRDSRDRFGWSRSEGVTPRQNQHKHRNPTGSWARADPDATPELSPPFSPPRTATSPVATADGGGTRRPERPRTSRSRQGRRRTGQRRRHTQQDPGR